MKRERFAWSFGPVVWVMLLTALMVAEAAALPVDRVRQMGGTGVDEGNDVAALQNGDIVVGGDFHSTAEFAGGASVASLTSNGASDGFLARYSELGALIWAIQVGGAQTDSITGVAPLLAGGVMAVGYFGGTATFGHWDNGTPVTLDSPYQAMFIARYNQAGEVVYVRKVTATIEVRPLDVDTLPNDEFFVTGYFGGTATFAPGKSVTSYGYRDIFVAKYNAIGDLLWVTRAGGDDYDEGRAVVALPDGGAAITGAYQSDPVSFSGLYHVWERSAGKFDMFVARYRDDGTLLWEEHGGGVDEDGGEGITFTTDGGIVVVGHFVGEANFSSGGVANAVQLDNGSSGDSDAFVIRYQWGDGLVTWSQAEGRIYADVGRGVAGLPDGGVTMTGSSVLDLEDILVARYGADGER